jgi:hypothetical protein
MRFEAKGDQRMKREKGIAYCGLTCCVCSENETCVGCKNQGCRLVDRCKNFNCCTEKGLAGCWECDEFPCSDSILDSVRIKAFARFIGEYGEEMLMDCLERNERAGIVYHYEGELTGDYDKPSTEEEIIAMILNGKTG